MQTSRFAHFLIANFSKTSLTVSSLHLCKNIMSWIRLVKITIKLNEHPEHHQGERVDVQRNGSLCPHECRLHCQNVHTKVHIDVHTNCIRLHCKKVHLTRMSTRMLTRPDSLTMAGKVRFTANHHRSTLYHTKYNKLHYIILNTLHYTISY